MALPASTQIKSSAVAEVLQGAARLKGVSTQLRNDSAAGVTGRSRYLSLMRALSLYIDRVNVIKTIPGLAAYANSEIPGYVGDFAVDAQATLNATVTLRDWLFSVLETTPIQSNPDNHGNRTELTLTTAQTATFRTNVDSFVATID